MLTLSPNTHISLCTTSIDMRKSFDGLLGIVRNVLEADLLADHLFVFLNRHHTLMKIPDRFVLCGACNCVFGDLYKLERTLKKVSAGERHSMRQQLAVPVLNDIFTWCSAHREKFLPKEPITSAIQYALNQEVALRRYCEDDQPGNTR